MQIFRTTLFNTGFKGEKKPLKITAYNPYTNSNNTGNVNIDLTESQQIILPENSRKCYSDRILALDYNPDFTGLLYDKVNNKPLKTVILKSSLNDSVSYNFMSEDLTREYGYVSMTSLAKGADALYDIELLKNYREQDIVGPRVIVDYLQNWNDKEIGGIGVLADKLAVKYCLDEGIGLNIVSFADSGSHAAHYRRGKRFFPISKDSEEYGFFKKLYGIVNVNKILKQALRLGKRIDLSNWGHLAMYMPKELAKKYAEEILKSKIR